MTPLEDLLDRVAEALLAGDLARVGELGPQIEAQAENVRLTDSVTANRLQSKARRNARLLDAAARGVKAARQRMTECRANPQWRLGFG
jgi:hypothetical protein